MSAVQNGAARRSDQRLGCDIACFARGERLVGGVRLLAARRSVRGAYRGNWQRGQKYVGRPINPAIRVFIMGCEHLRHGWLSRP